MPSPLPVEQIEYRWAPGKDLTPVASSLPPGAEQSWDALIYSWVRHPETDVTAESVRYQVLPDGRTVLAWRYRDQRAATGDDGGRGRPVVSRVLVAPPGLLPPPVAIALGRGGLPGAAGPPPGEVRGGDPLPSLSAGELGALVSAQAEALDALAVRETGLARLLTAALAEPGLPLSVQLRTPFIGDRLALGPQPLLLWGLWRLGRPLLGPAGRGWSFSTFEAPLGDSDPALLPDVVFRLDQPMLHPPARPRPELRVRPRDPRPPDTLDGSPELAAWLVEEYQRRGGDELARLVDRWAAGAPFPARVGLVYDRLRSRRRPFPAAQQPGRPAPDPEPPGYPEPDPAATTPRTTLDQRLPSPCDPAERQPAKHQPTDHQLTEAQLIEHQPAEPGPATLSQADRPTGPNPIVVPAAEPAHRPLPGYDRAVSGFAPLPPAPADPPPPATPPPPPPAAPPPEPRPRANPPLPDGSVPELLGQLAHAQDGGEFAAVLQRVRAPGVPPDLGDRRKACYWMQNNRWHIPDLLGHGFVPCEDELAAVFRVILLPDLDLVQVQRQIPQWIVDAGPTETRPLIRALLLAPIGAEAGKQMRRILRPGLAARLVADYECLDLWPAVEPEPPELPAGGQSGSGLRRLLRGGRS